MIKVKSNQSYIKVLFLSFIVTACAIIPILIINNGKFFVCGDYMTQQLPFMKECRRVILSGTPFWSANTFLGANFWGTYSFYVYGSPFFWPLLIVPEEYMSNAISVLFVLKHVVAALTAHLYLKRHIKNQNFAIIGALMYAFSGYTIDSSYYYHFLDVIAFFPLILYFTDRVLDNERKQLLSLVVFISAITNYYFIVATSFIFIFYLFFRVKYSNDKYTIKDGVRCIISYCLGGLASAVILIPSAMCLLETSKATDGIFLKLLAVLATFPEYFKFLEAFVLPSEGIMHSGVGFTYLTYNSTAIFLPFFGAVFYFVALRRKEKTWDLKLLKFFTILTFIPFGNGLFSLFTNMLYTRWWYGFVLIMILVSLKVLQSLENNPNADTEIKKSAKTITIIAIVVTVIPIIVKLACVYVIGGLLKDIIPGSIAGYLKSTGLILPINSTDVRYFVVLIGLTVLSYLPLYLTYRNKMIFTKKVIPIVAVICLITYGTYLTNENITSIENSPNIFTENTQTSVKLDTIYTSRVQNRKTLANYSMISNEPGISTFHSFKSHATTEFARIAGYNIGTMPTTKMLYSTPAIQTVLSVETIVNADSSRIPAPYYTPMGYVYEYYIDDNVIAVNDKKENNRRIELMTQACYLDKETSLKLKGIIKPLESDKIDWKEACKQRKLTACTDFVMDTKGFTATANGGKERLIYFSVPHDNGWTAYINGQETEIYTINGGMMGIVAPKGNSSIEFKFVPPGLKLGLIVSFVSIFIIICYAIIDFKKQKIKPYS